MGLKCEAALSTIPGMTTAKNFKGEDVWNFRSTVLRLSGPGMLLILEIRKLSFCDLDGFSKAGAKIREYYLKEMTDSLWDGFQPKSGKRKSLGTSIDGTLTLQPGTYHALWRYCDPGSMSYLGSQIEVTGKERRDIGDWPNRPWDRFEFEMLRWGLL